MYSPLRGKQEMAERVTKKTLQFAPCIQGGRLGQSWGTDLGLNLVIFSPQLSGKTEAHLAVVPAKVLPSP